MEKSLNDLYDTYVRTRHAIHEAMPDANAMVGLEEVIYMHLYVYLYVYECMYI
jgi:hypothetical protein